MPDPEQPPGDDPELVTIRTKTSEHAVSITCGACGAELRYDGEGRPRRYCSDTCRTRGWALRKAAEQLGVALPPPVVEVRERTVTRTVAPRGPRIPTDAPSWHAMLTALATQLADPRSLIHMRYWDHRGIYNGLMHAMAALGEAHPGGLDQFANPADVVSPHNDP